MAINFSEVKKIEIQYPYEQVEYIYFNGVDNYIIPGYTLNTWHTSPIELEFSLDTKENYKWILACETNLAVGPYFWFGVDYGNLYIRYNNNAGSTEQTSIYDVTTGVRYKILIEPNSGGNGTHVKLTRSSDNVVLVDTILDVYLPPSGSPYLMANKTVGGTIDDFTNGKIYYMKLNNVLYVPCINKSTGDIGLIKSDLSVMKELEGTVTSSSKGNRVTPTITLPTAEVKQISISNNIVWRKNKLVSITLSGQNTSLPINTSFSFGGTVTATYSDGTTANVTSSTIFSGYNMSTAGTQTITATYTEAGITKTATYSLDVVAVSSIALSGQTTTLPVDASFSFGGTVTATYSNGTTADVTNSTTFSGYDMSTGGTYTVTASYTENNVTVTATYQLTVAAEVTISYRRSITNGAGTLPSSKTVTAGYVLTAADLPSDGTTWTIDGWTIDGINKVSVGYVVNEDITLCAVHKRTYTTSSSLFKSAKNHKYEQAFTLTIDGGNVGNSTNSGTTKTYSLSKTYNATKPSYDYYRVAQLGGWGGLVFSEVTANPCRIEWTPSRSTVTFSSSMSGGTNAYNYGGTYPTLVVRNNSSGSFIYSKTQNNTNKITYETVSGAIFYIQHGGNDGGQKYASRADYKQQGDTPTSSQYGITCNAGKATETVYVYTLPPVS